MCRPTHDEKYLHYDCSQVIFSKHSTRTYFYSETHFQTKSEITCYCDFKQLK